MFDLESAIENWKQAFCSDGSVSRENVFELEVHLRDLTCDLQRKGLSEQEAFMVGSHRLGYAAELEEEFEKNCPTNWWRSRVLWMLAGYIAVTAGGSLISILVTLASTSALVMGWGGNTTGLAMVVLQSLCWIGVLGAIYRLTRKAGVGSDRVTVLSAVCLGMLFLLAPILSYCAHIINAKTVVQQELGQLLYWRQIGGLVVHIVVCASTLAMICLLSKPKIERSPANGLGHSQ